MTLVYDFAYDGGGLHKGGTGVLMVNGKKVGRGAHREDDGAALLPRGRDADIGKDDYSPVTKDYDPWDNAFTGTIRKVTIQLKD